MTTIDPTFLSGLHTLMEDGWDHEFTSKALEAFIYKLKLSLAESTETFVAWHELAHLVEAELSTVKKGLARFQDAEVTRLNADTRRIITKFGFGEQLIVVPVFDFTMSGAAIPLGDGVHYREPYQSILVNIDFRLPETAGIWRGNSEK
ncbi:hypothetical protein P7C70_g1646, partial [Phenoliferia sp. Uapishka_3]